MTRTTQMVPLSEIRVKARLRDVDRARVEALALSFRDSGMNQAIIVRPLPEGGLSFGHDGLPKSFDLVAGAHRLAAAALLEWKAIECRVEDLSDLQARLVEIDENLIRHELSALDRAIFLAERQKVWVALHPETQQGGDRKSRAAQEKIKRPTWPFDFPQTFSKEAAERTGLSERSVRRAIDLVSKLWPETIKALRGTPIADNAAELRRLADLDPESQFKAARTIAEGAATSVAEARVAIGLDEQPETVDEREALYRRIISLLERADATTFERVRAYLAIEEQSA